MATGALVWAVPTVQVIDMGQASAESPSGVTPPNPALPGTAERAAFPAETGPLASTGSSGLSAAVGLAGAGLVGGGAAVVIIGHKAATASATAEPARHTIDADRPRTD